MFKKILVILSVVLLLILVSGAVLGFIYKNKLNDSALREAKQKYESISMKIQNESYNIRIDSVTPLSSLTDSIMRKTVRYKLHISAYSEDENKKFEFGYFVDYEKTGQVLKILNPCIGTSDESWLWQFFQRFIDEYNDNVMDNKSEQVIALSNSDKGVMFDRYCIPQITGKIDYEINYNSIIYKGSIQITENSEKIVVEITLVK